jgi:hypothetical protein
VPPDPFPTVTFEDVQPGSPFYTYIEIAHQRGYTAGCATNPLRYCPQQPVTREQMPVFILTALDPPLPTFTPAPTATPMAPSVGATTSPGGGGLMGLLLLALGFGSAIALPIALSAKRQPAEETGRT